MISLRLNGQAFSNFISINVSNSLQALSGKFSFVATDANDNTFPFAAGDRVQVLLSEVVLPGQPESLIGIANGFIDAITINYSRTSHTVHISGRDKTADVIDSQIADLEFHGNNLQLKTVIQKTLDFLGITDIKVIDNVGKIDPFKQGEVVVAQQAESAFSFINKYAEKRQVLISNDGDGNIVLTRVENPLRNGLIMNLQSSPELNNIMSAHVTYDNSQRFNEYKVISQGNPAAECVTFSGKDSGSCGLPEVPSIVNKIGKAEIDKEIRTTRKFILVPSATMTADILAKRARWENALRKARSTKYHVTLQGFLSNDGLIWQAGQLVKVRDQFASIDADLIVSEITYNFTVKGGSTTTLTLVEQDVYKALLEIDKLKAKVNQMGTADSKVGFAGEPDDKGNSNDT